MAKKNLPVKLFQKRQKIDDRRVEGMQNKIPPKWQLSGEELTTRSNVLVQSLETIQDYFKNIEHSRSFIPATIRVDINDEAIAKSYRTDIQKLFDSKQSKNNIIGFIESNSAIIKINNQRDILQIQKNIQNHERNAKGISAVESIEIFKPFITNLEKGETIKISLINYLDYELNNAIRSAFKRFCKERQLVIKEANYSSDLFIYKIQNITKVDLDSISDFEALESITIMPKYSVGMDFIESNHELDIKIPKKDTNYPIIGVLDSGISKNKYLQPWLLERKHSSYPEELTNTFHGTCVSSLIVYGDELENKNWTGNSGAMLFDATVFPDNKKETIYEDELIENIREAISNNKDIKIWNLSLGTASESNINEFSDFGKALDHIQLVNNVIICKSTGNCSNFKNGFPKSRIAKSGDSMRALVVGSIAHTKNSEDLSEINHPSPFSRIGPGPSNSIKPDLMSYGGNAGVQNGRIIPNGVRTIAPDGSLVEMIGTSFSTPRITSLLSELNFKIKEDFNITLLKALAIHSAKYPYGVKLQINDKIKQMGFGIPNTADEIIYNDPHEITLILQENINKGEYIEILEFPFPESLVDDEGYFYGEIKITLVSQPVLRETQGAEYCQSNLKFGFGTYDDIKNRDTTKSYILNSIAPNDPQNVMRDSNYGAASRKDTTSDYARERILLNYGKKYQPIKKYSVNLNEMTPSRKRHSLEGNRKWFARIKGEYRNFAETLATKDGEVLNQDFTLIVTIRDTKGKHQVYNEVSRLLANRNFIHSNIKIRENIRINIQGKQ